MSGDHNEHYMKAEVVEHGLKRKREADLKIGAWLSAALEDPSTCQSMRDDIIEWFRCTPQMEAPKREWVGLTDEDTQELIAALEEAVYLLNPTDEDMQKKAGVYRVVSALEKLKGRNT